MNPGCRECSHYLPNHTQCLREFDVRKGLAGMCSQFRDKTDGATGDYKEHAGQCYVCFIHSKVEEPKQ